MSQKSFSQLFIDFTKLVRYHYLVMVDAHPEIAEIIESAWTDVCAAGSKMPHKIIPFHNPNTPRLLTLLEARPYIYGQMTDEYLHSRMRYLDACTEFEPIAEYILAFTAKYLDIWSVHPDAAYVHCKLRACGVIFKILRSNSRSAIERCRRLDEFVLHEMKSDDVNKYIRLATNKNTFASITNFCKHAIDAKRDDQIYICKLIEFIDKLRLVKCAPEAAAVSQSEVANVAATGTFAATFVPVVPIVITRPKIPMPPKIPPPPKTPHPHRNMKNRKKFRMLVIAPETLPSLPPPDLPEVLYGRYTLMQIKRIARAFGMNCNLPKKQIIQDLIDVIGNNASDEAFINEMVTAWGKI